jgi:hypothetical protein
MKRSLPASSAHVNAEFVLEWCQSPLERPDHARRDAGRMPVHAHDGAKRLKPEGIGKPPQQLVPSVVMNDCLRHDRAETRHPVGQPGPNVATV